MTEFCPNCGEEYGDCKCGEKPKQTTLLPNEGVGFLDKIVAIAEKASQQAVVPQAPVSIEVKNLVVAPQQNVSVVLGDTDSFKRITEKTEDVKAIIWNEDAVSLMTDDRTKHIVFAPEMKASADLFFQKEKKKNESEEYTVWQGDYEPVEFTKRDLLKFLAEYGKDIPDQIRSAIKNMRVTETQTQDEILLDDDEADSMKTVKEEKFATNLPKRFTVKMQLTNEFWADLAFECEVAKAKDRYGNEKGKQVIHLRCTNARQVMQDLMGSITDLLPKGIPRYYGRLSGGPKKRTGYGYDD